MDLSAIAEAARSAWVVWLIILFLGVVFWAFRPKNRRPVGQDGVVSFKNDEDAR